MKLLRNTGSLLPGLALAFAAACSSGPAAPTAIPTTTEVFEGNLAPGTSNTHLFSVSTEGRVTIVVLTLGLADPSQSAEVPPVLGMAIGTWDGTTCSRVSQQDAAIPSSALLGTALPGNFCLDVFDPGSLTLDVAYSLSVEHP